MSYLTNLIKRRKSEKRDVKIIITARNSQTGTGKTTLAVKLARYIDNNWDSGRACFDVPKYSSLYDKLSAGSCIILDEVEQAADNRRSMSGNNVSLSHAWAMLRYRQISTILTLPSASMLDKRMVELADVRIVVLSRGVADVKEITIDDNTGKIYQKKVQRIRWGNMDGDPDYEKMNEMKHDYTVQLFDKNSSSKDLSDEVKKLKIEIKDLKKQKEAEVNLKEREMIKRRDEEIREKEAEVMYKLRETYNMSTAAIANVFGCSNGTAQNRIQKYKREQERALDKNTNSYSVHPYNEILA